MEIKGLDTVILKTGLRKYPWEVIRTFYLSNDREMIRIDLVSNFDPDGPPLYNCILFYVHSGYSVIHPPKHFASKSVETSLTRATAFAAQALDLQLPGT